YYYNTVRKALSVVLYTYIYINGDHGYYLINSKVFNVVDGSEIDRDSMIAQYETVITDKINHYIEENELELTTVTPQSFKDTHVFYGTQGLVIMFDNNTIGDFASTTPTFEFDKRLNIRFYKTQPEVMQ